MMKVIKNVNLSVLPEFIQQRILSSQPRWGEVERWFTNEATLKLSLKELEESSQENCNMEEAKWVFPLTWDIWEAVCCFV
jgi:hypothetical protein